MSDNSVSHLFKKLERIASTGVMPATKPKWYPEYGPPHRVADRTNITPSRDAHNLHPHRTFGPANTAKLTRATATIQHLTPTHIVPSTWGTLDDWKTAGKRIPAHALRNGVTLTADAHNPDGTVVYHATQATEYTPPKPRPLQGVTPETRAATHTLHTVNIRVEESFHNTYSPLLDTITLMPQHCFTDAVHHIKAWAHELAHATGHSSRLNRPTLTAGVQPGDATYNQEEIVAELASIIVTGELLGQTLPPEVIDRSAEYVWRHLPTPKHLFGKLADNLKEAERSAEWILTNQRKPAPPPPTSLTF